MSQVYDDQRVEVLLSEHAELRQRIAKAKAILEHVHSRTWYDDVKQALAALEGK